MLNAVTDLGCVPGSSSFDNGALLTNTFKTVKETIYFPGGIYYHSTPVIQPENRNALKLVGAGGIQGWVRQGATDLQNCPSTIFMYSGDASKEAWQFNGDGVRLDGLNFWQSFYPNHGQLSNIQGTGIAWRNWGKRLVTHCSWAGWQKANHFVDSNHNDDSTFISLHFFASKCCFRCDESQATGNHIQSMLVYTPPTAGEEWTVFEWNKGGTIIIDSLTIVEPRLIFKFFGMSSNTCHYDLRNLKVDPNCAERAPGTDSPTDPGKAGWRLLEMTERGPLWFECSGLVGQGAVPRDTPTQPVLKLLNPTTSTFTPPVNYQRLDVKLWGSGPASAVDRIGSLWMPKSQNWGGSAQSD